VRLEVVGPDGKPRPFYAANLFTENGKAEGVVRFALNDPKGRWRIRAREIVSGLTGEATVTLK